jgi:hypothetical protein
MGSGGIATRILDTSALDGGEWSVSNPGYFIPREEGPLRYLLDRRMEIFKRVLNL